MTEPIEQRLLRLAEKATPGPWHDGEFTHNPNAIVSADDPLRHHIAELNDLPDDLGSPWANAAFIAALSPSTVSRLARVVEAARRLVADRPIGDGYVYRSGTAFDAVRDSLSALDAEQEGAE